MSAAASAASAAAAAAAASASASAARAKKATCNIKVDSFDSYKATIQEKKEYADCVKYLHPDPMSSDTAIVIKVAIIFVIGCTIFGFLRGAWKDGFEGSMVFGLRGLSCSALFVLLAFLAVIGIQFVFS